MSTITTHILDTARGKPSVGVSVILSRQQREWTEIARGITNADGRIGDLLPNEAVLSSGVYKLRFETGAYFTGLGYTGLLPLRRGRISANNR